jgi:hypothetical protein
MSDGVQAVSPEEVLAQRKKRLVDALSQCSSMLDFPPEVVGKILEIKPDDAWRMGEIINAANQLRAVNDISLEDIPELLDLARVVRIMEEQDPFRGVRGVTGPQGPQGSPGISPSGVSWGVTGPQGAVGLIGPDSSPPGANGPAGPNFPQKNTDPALLAKFAKIKKDLGLLNPIPGLPNIPKK